MKVYKCASYERLSKEDLRKKDESSSIESQRMIIQSFCKFNELEIIDDYVDDGYSGGNFDRPGFKRMIEDIESGKINCVITKDLSRLGRELYQTGTFVEDYFCDKKIRYIAINDGYDSNNDYNEGLSLKLTYNDYALRDTSRKVKTSFRAKQSKGEYLGTIARYGYVKDPEDNHHLIIDPIAAGYVKEMYSMALAGESTVSIANYLTSKNVPIPIVYKKEKRGAVITDNNGNGIWKHQTVKSILTSQMYIGNMVQNTFNKIRYNSKKIRAVDPEDYIIVEGTHEPIIDKDTFDKVQKILKVGLRVRSYKKDKYLFSGLLKCKECGHNISILERKNKGNNSHYTQCNLYAKKGKYGACSIHRINYNILEKDLLEIIEKVCETYLKNYDSKILTKEANEILCSEIDKINNELEHYKAEQLKLNNVIEKLYIDKVEGKIPENVFNNLIDKYNNELIEYKTKIDNLNNDLKEKELKTQKLDEELCEKAVKRFLLDKKVNRGLIIELVNRVEIDSNKNIELFFNFEELPCLVG